MPIIFFNKLFSHQGVMQGKGVQTQKTERSKMLYSKLFVNLVFSNGLLLLYEFDRGCLELQVNILLQPKALDLNSYSYYLQRNFLVPHVISYCCGHTATYAQS